MTLVEIMVVVIIMAMIATAVGVAVIPQMIGAQIRATRADVGTVRQAAETYLLAHPGEGCPSMDDLEGDYLTRSARTQDAWENDFQILCEGTEVIVRSAGPDGQMGTDDDIE